MRSVFALAAIVAVLPLASATAQTTIYSTDFESGTAPSFTGAGSVQGTGTLGGSFGRLALRNDSAGNPAAASILTLSGLSAYTSLTLNFDFVAWDSWDGRNGTFPTDDYFNVDVGTTHLLDMSPSNSGIGPEVIPANATLIRSGGAYGYGTGTYFDNDRAWNVNIANITPTSDTMSFAFYASGNGWQGGSDESWSIDNVALTGTLRATTPGAVPEPATWATMVLGFGAIGAAARRRRAITATA